MFGKYATALIGAAALAVASPSFAQRTVKDGIYVNGKNTCVISGEYFSCTENMPIIDVDVIRAGSFEGRARRMELFETTIDYGNGITQTTIFTSPEVCLTNELFPFFNLPQTVCGLRGSSLHKTETEYLAGIASSTLRPENLKKISNIKK